MERQKNQFIVAIVCLSVIVILVGCLAFCFNGATASAATINDNQEAEARGLYTQMSVTIGVEGDFIWAEAHNDFTLGKSTIQVYVELYSSLEKKDSCSSMKLEDSNYIADLDIRKSLYLYVYTGGVQKYWRAKMRYKLDNKEWVSKETSTILVDGNGNWIS